MITRPNRVLPQAFYDRATQQVARELLGKRLVRRASQGTTAGRIVEVEAYLDSGDPACHAARGKTPSNRAMFGPPGRAYVYPIHSRYCLNTVTEARGIACAVLIRAVEPTTGIELMMRRRRTEVVLDLARGPARLCESFAVDRRLDHWNLTRGRRLWIEGVDAEPMAPDAIGVSTRIGVTSGRDFRYRFFVDGCRYVSGRRRDHRQPIS